MFNFIFYNFIFYNFIFCGYTIMSSLSNAAPYNDASMSGTIGGWRNRSRQRRQGGNRQRQRSLQRSFQRSRRQGGNRQRQRSRRNRSRRN